MIDANVVYRHFDVQHHLADQGDGLHRRLSSTVFRDKNGVSVDNGALSSAQDTHARHPGGGVLSITKAELQTHGFTITSKPIAGNPAHCEIGSPSEGKAKRLARTAMIVIAPPGYAVDATGKMLRPLAVGAGASATTPTPPANAPPTGNSP